MQNGTAATTTSTATEFKASPPPILVWEGQEPWQAPRYEVRYFHRRKVEVWNGYVQTKDVVGWVGNVRIDLFVEKWKRDHGETLPTNEDILQWMMHDPNSEFDLKPLGESIVKNGVRQKIVITAEGILLDGNRRYFASLMKLREAEKSNDRATLDMVKSLPSYVLSPLCGKDDLDAVLVEENFVDDCRLPWPNYIKATRVYGKYQELKSERLSKQQAIARLVDEFGISKGQVERFLKMMDFIQEFHDHHSEVDEETGKAAKDDFAIKWSAQRHFEYFDELTKTQVVNTLNSDPELRAKVFERLYDGDFASFVQVRKIPAISADRRARDIFVTGDGPKAVKDSIDWINVAGIARKAMANNDRVVAFKRFLDSLSAEEIADLDPEAVQDLQSIAGIVARMAQAVRK
ncbi:MAG: hypothetical protein JSS95_15555 [Acidobacteria bacterium]|nr:hypothetical protein [Acidobacteriota bacterium]